MDMVRPGLLAYGYFPSSQIPLQFKEIAPVLSLKKLLIVKHSKRPGYQLWATYITKESSRIVIPVGYGDSRFQIKHKP